MAYSKVAYGGHTLIDLTQDTAVEADVASGKYFHKANGERVQGTASGGGGITPSGTIYLDDNGTSDVSAYAYAEVTVPANFPRTVTIGIIDPGTITYHIWYRGADSENNAKNVKWREKVLTTRDDGVAVTTTISLVSDIIDPDDPAETQMRDGFYIITDTDSARVSAVGATYRFDMDNGSQPTLYYTVESNTVTLTFYTN